MTSKYATLYLLLLTSALAACSGEQDEEFGSRCTSNQDCELGQVCTDGLCTTEEPVRPQEETIAVIVSTEGGAPAEVAVEIEGRRCEGGRCEGRPGDVITFTAQEVSGYRFAGWSGHPLCRGTRPVLHITATGTDISCTAQYVKRVLVTGTAPEGAVRAGSSAPFSKCTASACEVDAGSQVTLTAPLLPGRRFAGWQGDACTPPEALTIVVTTGETDVTCGATYGGTLQVSGVVSGAEGEVTASSDAPGALCSGARCTVAEGESVTLRAPDIAGHRFAGWSGNDACTGTARELVLTGITGDLECTANYVRQFVVRGVSAGTPEPVALTASSEDTSATCADGACQVDAGGSATLIAPTVEGYRFTGFSGDGCDNVNGAAVTVSAVSRDVTCTAHYVRGIAIIGSVVGLDGAEVTASSNTPAAQCSGGTCIVDAGGDVTLVAPAAPTGRRFLGWEGDPGCTGTNRTLTFTDVQQSLSCVARYTPRFSVSGVAQPAGAGTITASSSSAQATCSGASCEVDPSSRVELRVTPQTGFRFSGWTGTSAACTGTATTLVLDNVQGNITCTANFIARVTVDVASSPALGGLVSVASTSPDAACLTTRCTVDVGSNVTATATASPDYRFVGWSGCSNSTNATLTLSNVTTNTVCTATFVQRFTVTGNLVGAPSGSVSASSTASAPVANCSGNQCVVDANSNVTLTAPDFSSSGYRFDGWSGTGCSGNSLTLTINPVTANRTCTANYARLVTVAINRTPTDGGTIQISTNDSRATCTGAAGGPRSCTMAANSSVTISAADNTTSRFMRWSGASACNTTNASATFTVTSNTTCTAEYYRMWAQVYQQTGVDSAKSVAFTPSGELLVAGQSQVGTGLSFARIARLSPIDGLSVFDRAYAGMRGGTATNAAQIITTNEGSLLFGNFVSNAPTGAPTFLPWLLSLDRNHEVVWSRLIEIEGMELVAGTQIADGGFVAVGRQGDTARILKVAANGNLVFNHSYRFLEFCTTAAWHLTTHPVAVVPRGSGFVVLHSIPLNDEFRLHNALITVHTANGSITAYRRFNIFNYSIYPSGLVTTSDNGLLIVGSTDLQNTQAPGQNGVWFKLNSSFNVQYSRMLSAQTSYDEFNAVVTSADGDEFVVVGTGTGANRDTQGWVVRINATNGELIEHVALGAPGAFEELHDIKRADGGGYVLVGSTHAGGNGRNLWALRVDDVADIRFNATSGVTRTVLTNNTTNPGVAAISDSCTQTVAAGNEDINDITYTISSPATTRTTQAP